MIKPAHDVTGVIENALKLIREFKSPYGAGARTVTVRTQDGAGAGRLVPVRVTDEDVRLLTEWRERFMDAFPTQFRVTGAGTRAWLEKQVMGSPGRILFMVRTPGGRKIGHMGYAHTGEGLLGFTRLSAEIDNVVRGIDAAAPGMMTAALRSLMGWGFSSLGMKELYLRVFADNAHAVKFYERCGFEKVRDIPLKRLADGEIVTFTEISKGETVKPDRFFRLMAIRAGGGSI